MGYDLASAQLTGLDYDAFISKGGELPDVILVRKSYEEKRRKKRAKVRTDRPIMHQEAARPGFSIHSRGPKRWG